MMNFIGLVGLFVAVAVDSCQSFVLDTQCTCSNVVSGSGYTTKTYHKMGNSENVVNPGRGFYHHAGTNTANFEAIQDWMMDGTKNNVLLRIYYLSTFTTHHLTTSFTDKVKADLEKVKRLGWTVVLRFAYTEETDGSDARLSRVLQHIGLLDTENVFREYEGYITAIQAGFIGAWGEWYYTNSDFGKPGSCSSSFGLTGDQWAHRKQVLYALLNAAPKSIEICVRIPAFKYHILGDKSITTLHEDETFTDKSRIAFHNDAFLSDEHDQGTFVCPDDKQYMADDSVYNVVIGETNDGSNPQYFTCDHARSEMKKYHYSILNGGYNEDVTGSWKHDHCYDEFAAHLGYRLYLTKAILPPVAQSGGQFCYQIDIANDGYAAPHKELEAHILLRNTHDGTDYSAIIPNMNFRLLQPGKTFPLKGSVTIPKSLPSGTYAVWLILLHKATLGDNRYFILLANTGNVQDVRWRLNNLHHTITISHGGCSATGQQQLLKWPAAVGTGGSVINTGAAGCAYSLKDGSFETGSGWINYLDGYTRHTTSPQNGHYYARVTNGAAEQQIQFHGSSITQFTLSGYSRPHSASVSVSNPDDYSIYCDITDVDGKEIYGFIARFSTSASGSGWHKATVNVNSHRPIEHAACYAMFRNGHGEVDFDNFHLDSCS